MSVDGDMPIDWTLHEKLLFMHVALWNATDPEIRLLEAQTGRMYIPDNVSKLQ